MATQSFTPEQDQFILDNHGKVKFVDMAKRFGKTKHSVRGRWLTLTNRRNDKVAQPPADELDVEKTGEYVKRKLEGNTEWLSSCDANITSVEELLAHCKVDLTVWQVKSQECNAYQSFFKNTSKKVADDTWHKTAKKVQLFQIKVRLERISPEENANKALRAALIEDMNKHSPVLLKIDRRRRVGKGTMLELALFDPHFGKLAWARETGQNWDLKECRSAYDKAGDHLLHRAESYNVDKILVPIGNDMIHVDGRKNMTTGGTPQDVDSRHQKAFLEAKRSAIELIEKARTIAPVEVVVVPGNHDRESMFFLGDSIQSWFRLADDVHVNNAPTLRKYVEYGVNLLGFTHGSEEGNKRLNHLMQTEQRAAWARCRYFEWHVGHLHIKRKRDMFIVDTETVDTMDSGIIKRWLPSLCATDAWHAMCGYIGAPRGAEAYLWDYETGYAGHIAYNYKL